MRIAVVNETSTADRNADVLESLDGRGHEVINVGMRKGDTPPILTYIQAGLLSALLIATERADFVVGGCSTGQGFASSVNQFPGVFCGLIATPLDAWLYNRINAGNCVSLRLNQEYGWGAQVNLRMIFDALFGQEMGAGYPAHRAESERNSRILLADASATCHRSMAEIVRQLSDRLVEPVLTFPGVWELLDVDSLADRALAAALADRYVGFLKDADRD